MKFRSFEVALNLHKCTKQPRMDYCYIAEAGGSSFYLTELDMSQKQVYRNVGPTLAPSLET